MKGWEGEDCSAHSCKNDCSGKGECMDGKCNCTKWYSGDDCSTFSCPNDCSGSDVGVCVEGGKCKCLNGHTGADCSTPPPCPNDCNGVGTCTEGKCTCPDLYSGEACEIRACYKDCHGSGVCDNGKCTCNKGFDGKYCQFKVCPSDKTKGLCSAAGTCDRQKGTCKCNKGFVGCACSHSLKAVNKECSDKCTTKCMSQCEKGASASFLEVVKGYIIPNNAPSADQAVGSPEEIEGKVESQSNCFATCDAQCRPPCVKELTQVNC